MLVCWIVYGFIVAANGVGFWAIRHDKQAARAQHRANPPRRIPEKRLWALAFFGGFVGMMVAMGRYRHKTRKRSFQVVFFIAAFVSTVVWVGWLNVLGCLGGWG